MRKNADLIPSNWYCIMSFNEGLGKYSLSNPEYRSEKKASLRSQMESSSLPFSRAQFDILLSIISSLRL